MGARLDEARGLAATIPYSPDHDEDHGDDRALAGGFVDPGSVEALIQFKDALEDAHLALAAQVDDVEANLREQLRTAELALDALEAQVLGLPPVSREKLLEDLQRQFELSRRYGQLQGAVDSWRIALGYLVGAAEPSSRAERDAAALDRLNACVPSEDQWRSAADFMEFACQVLREVRAPVPHYTD